MKVEELQVLISANADQFTGELVKVHQELKELNKATQAVGKATGKDLFGKILSANVATRVLTSTFRGMTRVVKSMSKGVFEGGTQLSRMRIATDTVSTNMGIASDKVDELRDSLAEANTYGLKAEEVINSLARTGLFAMAESLEAVDGRTGETVKGISALVLQMKDLGAVAGTSSSEAIAKITEFINRGNTQMVEGMIAVGNLGTEYRMYAKSIGKARNELTAQEEAEARLMLVHREAEKALGAYANAYTTSGKMIDSIRDATTSIFEEVGSYLEPIFASASSAILTFVSNVRNWLIANAQTFKDWAVKVSAYIIYVVRGIGQLLMGIPALRSFMKNLADFSFPKVETSADNTSKSLGGVNKVMKDTTESAKSLNKALAGLAGFDEMNVLNPPEGGGTAGLDIGGLGDVPLGAFGDLGELADEVNKKVKELEERLGTLKERIEKFTSIPLVKWLWENKKTILLVAGALLVLKKSLDKVITAVAWFGAVKTTFLPIILSLKGAFETVAIWVLYAKDAIFAFIGAISPVALIVVGVVAALVALEIALIKNWDAISNWLRGIADSLLEGETLIGGVVGSLITFFVDWNDVLLDFWGRVWKSVKAIDEALGDIINPFKAVREAKKENKEASEALELAEKDLRDATRDLEVAQKDLTVASGDLADAQLSLMDANDRVTEAQAEVTRLEQEGKTGTKEYERATLELTSAKGRQETAEQRVGEKQKEVKEITNEISTVNGTLTAKTNEVTEATKRLQASQDNLNSVNAERVADRVKRKWEEVKNSLGGIWDGFGLSIKNSLNDVIYYINRFLGKLRGKKIPILFPNGFNVPNIPYLAEGGIVDRPTVAMLGEAGREAVIPLQNNTGFIKDLAGAISESGGGDGQGVNLTVKLGEKDLYRGFIDYLNDRSLAGNSKLLKI